MAAVRPSHIYIIQDYNYETVKCYVIPFPGLLIICVSECWAILNELPSKCIGDVTTTSDVKTVTGDRILVTTSVDGSHLVMHVYKHGLVTMDIQFVGQEPLDDDMIDKVEFTNIKRIENKVKTAFGDKCKYSRIIPARIKRGELCPYFATSDSKLYEAGPSMKLLAEKNSKWQNIKIYSTEEFGAMLALDDDFNEWDADDAYNPTLLGTSRHSYVGKTVLILGGGGGALMADLYDHSPKYVVMVEIDEEVVNLCRQYIHDAVPELEGPNYKILIEDCYKVLKDYHEEGVKFDFIVNDLPEDILNVDEDDDESDSDSDDSSDAPESQLLTASLKVLADDGIYMSRGGSVTEPVLLDLIERIVTNHPEGLTFEKFTVDIPALNEKFCFYEVKRKKKIANDSA